MELKTYLRTLFRYWWIVLPALLVTLTATIVLTFSQTPVYSSTATFIVTPSNAFGDVRSFASGLDTLSRRTEIATTYTKVASSRAIRKAALDRLDLPSGKRRGLSVSSQLVAGTNILKITVNAPDPIIARDVADAVGAETITYTQNLYEPFLLKPLDEATLRKSPIKPSKKMNIILGGVFGLVLGAGLAFLADYLSTPLGAVMNVSIIDVETGVHNKNHFMQRMGGEIARAKRQRYPLSVVLLNIDHQGTLWESPSSRERSEILRKAALVLKQYLREEDLIAYFGGATFALLLPDMPGEAAKAMIEKLQMRVAWTPFELDRSATKIHLNSVAGVATLDHNDVEQGELVFEASRALQRAGTNGYDQACLATEEAINQHEQPT
jgi:diguanylate cyclase (GGDEF)-like protein